MKLNTHALRVIMCRENFNITSLSKAIGVDRSSVSHWLNGKDGRLTLPKLQKMVEILHMSHEEIINVLFSE